MHKPVTAAIPLSPQQKHVWNGLGNGSAAAQLIVLLEGPLDVQRLWDALGKIVERHEILRNTFAKIPGADFPQQKVSSGMTLASQEADLRAFGPARQNDQIEDLIQAGTKIDTGRVPTLQTWLVSLGEERRILLLSLPALCVDSWSLKNLARELTVLYAGKLSLTAAPQYLVYCESQRCLREKNDGRYCAGQEFWNRDCLRGAAPLRLPFVRPINDLRPFAPKTVHLAVNSQILEELRRAALVQTPDVLFTAWQILMSRLSGEQEIVTGYASHGRPDPEWHSAVGVFARTLPLHANLAGNLSFSELARISCEARAESELWQDHLPEKDIPSAMTASFQIEKRFARQQAGDVNFSVIWENLPVDRFCLQLRCSMEDEQPWVDVAYDPVTVDRLIAEQMTRRMPALLTAAALRPDDPIASLPVMDEGERRRVLHTFNQTLAEFPLGKNIPELFEEQVSRTPENTAIRCGEQTLSYCDLDSRANQLSHLLRGLGVQANTPVGLCLEPSAETICGLLGIWKAGGCCVPLSHQNSSAQLARQLNASNVTIVVTRHTWLEPLRGIPVKKICLDDETWSKVECEEGRSFAHSCANAAFIWGAAEAIGESQARLVSHAELLNVVHFFSRRLNLECQGDSLHFAIVSTLGDDLGTSCLLPCLISGGCLHIISEEMAADPFFFAEHIRQHPIDILRTTPSHLQSLLHDEKMEKASILPRRYLILGGGPLSWNTIDKLRSRGECGVLYHSSSLEASPHGCTFIVAGDDARSWSRDFVPIGRPLANQSAYILDSRHEPVPIGVIGELFFAALEDFAFPEMNREASHGFAEAASSLLRTGLRARFLPDGNIEYLGRVPAANETRYAHLDAEPRESCAQSVT